MDKIRVGGRGPKIFLRFWGVWKFSGWSREGVRIFWGKFWNSLHPTLVDTLWPFLKTPSWNHFGVFEAYITHFFQNEAENQKSNCNIFYQPFFPITWPNFSFLALFFLRFYSKMCFWDIAILSYGTHFWHNLAHYCLIFSRILKISGILRFCMI